MSASAEVMGSSRSSRRRRKSRLKALLEEGGADGLRSRRSGMRYLLTAWQGPGVSWRSLPGRFRCSRATCPAGGGDGDSAKTGDSKPASSFLETTSAYLTLIGGR